MTESNTTSSKHEMRALSVDEIESVSGGMSAGDLASAANKLVKSIGMFGGVIYAAAAYLSMPRCN